MYYEFNKHKKSDSIKWIVAFSLIFVLLVGMIASLIIGVKNSNTEEIPTQESVTDETPSNNDEQETASAEIVANNFEVSSTNSKSTNSGYMKLAFVGTPTLTTSSVSSYSTTAETPWNPEYVEKVTPVPEPEPEPKPYPYTTIDNDSSSGSSTNSGMETPVFATATNYISKTIQATIYPTTAENKTVSWTVEWGGSQTGSVTDYVKVIPTTNGSTTASVNCYKQFSGDIVITCTTQDGGYMATCTVIYKGLPTDINVNGTVVQLVNNEADLGIGQSYSFGLGLVNSIGSVGSEYNQLSASITGVGTIKVGGMDHYNSSGSEYWYEASIKEVSIDTLKDNFITASLSGNVLTITTLKSIESYYESAKKIDGGRTLSYTNKYYATVSECYFNVTITEAVSGFSKTFKVVLDEGVVTSVSLTNTELVF